MVLTLADDAQFAAAKRTLDECGFNESGLADPAGEDDPKALLASLFLQGASVPVERVRRLIPAEGFDALLELGLFEEQGESIRAAGLLYPLAGLHIASDFPGRDLGGEDFVFPAISQQTWEYLSILPDDPCGSLLEIGTGSGAAALLASRYADSVTATDISPRCVLFAEFNRRLNAVDGVIFQQADVFDGLPPEATFDRIVAHPPYVPLTGKQEAYRHGGPDGEALLRRLLGGLADRLRPGGTCHLATLGLDTLEGPLERRLRGMLGAHEAEFDLLLVEREVLTPLEFVLPWKEGEDMTFEEAWGLSQALQTAKARALVRCSILLERRATPGEPKTLRRKGGPATGAPEMAQELHRERPEIDWDQLLDASPEIIGEIELESISLPTEDGWRARTHILNAQYPFVFRTDCPAWAVELIGRIDGARTFRELLDPVDVDQDEVEIFLECLLEAGVLNVPREG
ncbi:MAG: methyltransferase [Bryobacterales bacterium]